MYMYILYIRSGKEVYTSFSSAGWATKLGAKRSLHQHRFKKQRFHAYMHDSTCKTSTSTFRKVAWCLMEFGNLPNASHEKQEFFSWPNSSFLSTLYSYNWSFISTGFITRLVFKQCVKIGCIRVGPLMLYLLVPPQRISRWLAFDSDFINNNVK